MACYHEDWVYGSLLGSAVTARVVQVARIISLEMSRALFILACAVRRCFPLLLFHTKTIRSDGPCVRSLRSLRCGGRVAPCSTICCQDFNLVHNARSSWRGLLVLWPICNTLDGSYPFVCTIINSLGCFQLWNRLLIVVIVCCENNCERNKKFFCQKL